MRRLLTAFLGLVLVLPLATGALAQSDFQSAAETWLALVDQGRYGDSWKAASASFREHVTAAAWQEAVKGAREPLGPLQHRSLTEDTHATTLPGAPDGDYEVLRYSSQFARKADAVETLILANENGTWKVAGYFIR
jgi:hypothetical protein